MTLLFGLLGGSPARGSSSWKRHTPGCDCCEGRCDLLDADLDTLATVQAQWDLRAGSWTDVDATGQLDLEAGGVELLAVSEPLYSPYGVHLHTTFRGRDTSVVRWFAGADGSVSLSAEITLGADCGELRFYEQSLDGETRIGDVHVIRELRGEMWHKADLCYDPEHGRLTMRILTGSGESWTFTTHVTATGQAGYGIGSVTDSVEFLSLTATSVGTTMPPCADVAVTTTRQGSATSDYSILLSFTSTNFSETISLYRPDGGGIPQTTVYASSGKTEAQVASEIMSWLVVASGNLGYYSTFTVTFQRGASDCTLTVSPDPAGAYAGNLTGINWLTITNAIRDDIYGTNELQTVTLTGYTTGTFTLTFDGQTTASIAATAAAATVQAALEALSSIGSGNVTVTGAAGAWVVEFVGMLAKTNVSEMTAASSLTSCGSYGYYYTIKCPTCAPGCDLAGSPFSATLSACDWDATGWTFGAGTATGTGTITHLAEIWTTPYVYRCELQELAYDYSADFTFDASTLSLEFRRVAAGEEWTYFLDAILGGSTLYSFELGTLAGDPDPVGPIAIRICRHAATAFLSITAGTETWTGETSLAALSGPGSIGLTTDQPGTVVTMLRATRHGDDVPGCDECTVTESCGDGCLNDVHPDALTVDAVGFAATGDCPCATLDAAYEPSWVTGSCQWSQRLDWPGAECVMYMSNVVEWIEIHVSKIVLGEWISVWPNHLPYGTLPIDGMRSLWEPNDTHYYLVVGVSLIASGPVPAIYYFAADLGPSKVDCLAFEDLELSYVGCSTIWYDNEAVLGRPPCGTKGAAIDVPAGEYFVDSTAKVYVTS